MDEARRFLRYIIPASGLALEFFVFAYLLAPDWAQTHLLPLVTEPKLATAAFALVGAGVAGNLLGILHHNLAVWISDYRSLDYRDIVFRLRCYVDYRNIRDGKSCSEQALLNLTRDQAWAVLNSLWYTRKEDPRIKGVDPRDQFLGDLVHSMGTAQLGAAISLTVAFVIGADEGPYNDLDRLIRLASALTIAATLLVNYHTTFRRTVRRGEDLAECALHDVLAEEVRQKRRLIVAHVLLTEPQPAHAPDATPPPASGDTGSRDTAAAPAPPRNEAMPQSG